MATKNSALPRLTLSVPEAGRVLGLGRNAAYEAARTGAIPVLRIGGKLLVSRPALERMLGLEPTVAVGAAVEEESRAA